MKQFVKYHDAHRNTRPDSSHRSEFSLLSRHNGCDGVSNHQPHDCSLNRSFRSRPKKISKFRVTGLRAGNSPVTGEFPAQMASNAENVLIWWRHLVTRKINTSSLSVLLLFQITKWAPELPSSPRGGENSNWSQAETYMFLKIFAIVRCERKDYLTFFGIDFEPLSIKLIPIQFVSR